MSGWTASVTVMARTSVKAGARRRNTHPAVCIGAVLAIGLVAGGCRQVMMPTPVIYHDERFDPFFNTPEEERSTIIPVFYATDRQRLGEADEPRYTNAIDLPLSLGQAKVRLGDERMTWEELREASTGPDRRRSVPLYLLDLDEAGALSTTADRREFSDERDEPGRELTSGERAFIDELNRQLAGSVNKDLTIYVHGFKVTFDNPCLVAAELHHFLAGNSVVMAYAWPSRQSGLLFRADIRRARASAPRLARLLEFLAAHSDAENINVLSYSAGAALAAEGLHLLRERYADLERPELRRDLRIGRVIFAAAAINLEEFKDQHFASIYEMAQRVVVLFSTRDTALAIAHLPSLGAAKLGGANVRRFDRERLERLAGIEHLNLIDASYGEVNRHNDWIGHAYWYANPWISSDVLASLRFYLPPEERGLARMEDKPVWYFPADYPQRIAEIAVEILGKDRLEPDGARGAATEP